MGFDPKVPNPLVVQMYLVVSLSLEVLLLLVGHFQIPILNDDGESSV